LEKARGILNLCKFFVGRSALKFIQEGKNLNIKKRNDTPIISPKLVMVGITILLGLRSKKKDMLAITIERKLIVMERKDMDKVESITI
jgi:hypothetical protein